MTLFNVIIMSFLRGIGSAHAQKRAMIHRGAIVSTESENSCNQCGLSSEIAAPGLRI